MTDSTEHDECATSEQHGPASSGSPRRARGAVAGARRRGPRPHRARRHRRGVQPAGALAPDRDLARRGGPHAASRVDRLGGTAARYPLKGLRPLRASTPWRPLSRERRCRENLYTLSSAPQADRSIPSTTERSISRRSAWPAKSACAMHGRSRAPWARPRSSGRLAVAPSVRTTRRRSPSGRRRSSPRRIAAMRSLACSAS
jgi:hypothetical protein